MAQTDAMALSPDELVRMRMLLDRQEIADCQARIARGADRFDRELYLSACHPGAQVSVGGHTSLAEESFEGGKAMHAAGTIATLHCLSTSNCEIDGDVAHAETYHIYCARSADETSWAATGRYHDQFERRNGVWGLVFRHISVEWTGKLAPMELALLEAADAPKHRLSPSRDGGDVSYLRPLAP
jgi:SnoaL-like domain